MREVGLIVVLVPALFGSLPTWPYSGSWGFLPCGLLGLALVATVAAILARKKERI